MFFAVAVIVVVAIGVVLLWHGENQGKPDNASVMLRKRLPLLSRSNEPSVARDKIKQARSSITNRTALVKRKIRFAPAKDNEEEDWIDENGKPWPQEQKQLMRAMAQAADDNDFVALSNLSALVMECPNSEIRERFVEELGWFWEKAVPELLGFMSDSNEEVAQAARDQWVAGVQTIDDDAEKAALLISVSKAMTDSEALEAFADELVGMDELLALQTIVDTIDAGTPQAVEAVKNAYENITGEKWSDVDAAEGWLQENYTPDDDISEATATGTEVMEGAEVKEEVEVGAEAGEGAVQTEDDIQ